MNRQLDATLRDKTAMHEVRALLMALPDNLAVLTRHYMEIWSTGAEQPAEAVKRGQRWSLLSKALGDSGVDVTHLQADIGLDIRQVAAKQPAEAP